MKVANDTSRNKHSLPLDVEYTTAVHKREWSFEKHEKIQCKSRQTINAATPTSSTNKALISRIFL
jgi:hypothetical protein